MGNSLLSPSNTKRYDPRTPVFYSQFKPKRRPVVDLLQDLSRDLHGQSGHRRRRVVRLEQKGEEDSEATLHVCRKGRTQQQ